MMGTNYYAKYPGQDDEGLHIGKYSAGLEFLWRAHEDLGLTSTNAWDKFLDHPWVTITAEYGIVTSLDRFWDSIVQRPSSFRNIRLRENHRIDAVYQPRAKEWRDIYGHPFANYEFC
jgi:hypothetical protein